MCIRDRPKEKSAMAPLRVSTTKSEWLPDDPTAFVPTRLWKLPFITTWDDSRNQNRPTDSAEEAKKVIATGVMNHDRFVGVDAPYRDAQKGGCWRPAPRVPGLEVKRSSDCTGPGRGRLE